MSFAKMITDAGLRPPVAADAPFLGPQWFWLRGTLPNAATDTIDLRTLFQTDPAILARYNPAPAAPDLWIHVEQVQPVLFSGASAGLALAEKAKLVQGMELHAKVGAVNIAHPIGPYIDEVYDSQTVTVDSDDTASVVQRGALHGNPLVLSRPLTLDLSVDSFEVKFSTATPASPGAFLLGFFGIVANKDVGGKVGDIKSQTGMIKCPSPLPEVAAAYDRATGALNARQFRTRGK